MTSRQIFWPARWAGPVVAAAALLAAPHCQAAKPAVVVEFVTKELPDDFRLPGVDIPGNLKRALEREAVQQLRTPFPLFSWIEQHNAGPATAPAATLILRLAKQPGVTWRIYLTGEFRLPGQVPTPLGLGEKTLYSDGDQYPEEIEQQTFLKGRAALAELLQGQMLDRWQTQFIAEIPIARDVTHANGSKLLVLPLVASELEAGDETRFRAQLDTQLPNKPRRVVFFLQPDGPENGDREAGKLECLVKEFRFNGVSHSSYVEEIADVIANKVMNTVVVWVTKYSRGQRSPVAFTLDSAEATP